MKLDAALRALVGGAPAQTDRLLKLHTPLGADVLAAERMEVVEAIAPTPDADAGAGFRIVVHAVSTDAHLELKQLIGPPALLELLTSMSRTALRSWHGHVTQAALVGSDGALGRYRLVIEPWLAFLAHRRDCWVFQGQTVQEIVDEVFADYQGQGALMPAWRWDLADASMYPRRSLCIQYQESDLQFVQRLLREEGLFCWFEHTADSHTLVLADHNGAFRPNVQPRVRYTQSGPALAEDSLVHWERQHAVRTAGVQLASRDYRSLSLRPVSRPGVAAPRLDLALIDVPGVYAYEDEAQGDRLVLRQMQAIDALREQAAADGALRTAAPATTFTLLDHPVHDGIDETRDRFVTLSVRHVARNNLRADSKAQIESLAAALIPALSQGEREQMSDDTEPLYRCELHVQRAAAPVRPVMLDEHGEPDPRLHRRPTVHGTQTALVVGLGEPVHTDRDHRIKVQFHWQRGSNGSHRLSHPAGDNAPANDASGTWVRVGERVAGANWGSHFVPRLGQEVVVAFAGGDIDRPVVVGSVYNGAGQSDAQGNQVAAGTAGSTGNANAWFPGNAKAGRFAGHQHAAVHLGVKTQELASSQSGAGGYNQLVFDDTPQANRIELSTTTAATRLQLGHLLKQNDNQRLNPRGHGLDLATAAWGAVRAGSGLLLSAHARPGSQSAGQQLDVREPLAAIEQAREIATTLAGSAQAHNAKLAGEAAADRLATTAALDGTLDSLNGTDSRDADPGSQAQTPIGGGAGTAVAWKRPDLILAAPAGIAALTPASTVISAGHTMSLVAGQDLHTAAQAHFAASFAHGVVLYTYGQAQNPDKPNQETGIALHAASGSVSTQSQSGATKLTASRSVRVSSTTAMVKIAAPKHVLLAAGGAGIHIEGGNITLKGSGSIQFKASMKELAGPGSAGASLSLAKPAKLAGCTQKLSAAAGSGGAFLTA